MPLGNDLVVNDALDRQEWLAPVAEAVAGAVDAAYDAAGPARKPIEDALNGVWLGHPLHAAIVTVPVGAWTAAAALDLMEMNGKSEMGPGADACVAIGLAGAAGAAVTGLTQWYPVEKETVRKVGITHALLNSTATLLWAGSLIARKKGERSLGRALGFMGWGVTMAGAYLGGSLSYSEHLGSDHAPRRGLPEEFTPVLDAAALAENTPTKAEANGVPLLLVKQGTKIHCLANTCSHFGGPLNEGELEDGCIRCPWHGSKFRLSDGGVEEGPATYGQPCLDVRVREGKIEVRAEPTLPQNHD